MLAARQVSGVTVSLNLGEAMESSISRRKFVRAVSSLGSVMLVTGLASLPRHAPTTQMLCLRAVLLCNKTVQAGR